MQSICQRWFGGSSLCLIALLAAACGHKKDQEGIACGNARCAADQVCCIDCDGAGLCIPAGSTCSGRACSADGGPSSDGAVGVECGDKRCAKGEACCIDCNGSLCIAPGSTCWGIGCRPDSGLPPDGGTADGGIGHRDGGSGVRCGNTMCTSEEVCCPGCCGLDTCQRGKECAPVPCDILCVRCGIKGQRCCPTTGSAPGCDDGLTCCSGVPYPTDGVCQESCPAVSDRNAKQDIESVTPEQVLERLASLPIATWRYTGEGDEVRHMGPMAQDFRAAFGLGTSERTIHMVDSAGVNMAAIQAIYRLVQELQREHRMLLIENRQMRRELRVLKTRSPSKD